MFQERKPKDGDLPQGNLNLAVSVLTLEIHEIRSWPKSSSPTAEVPPRVRRSRTQHLLGAARQQRDQHPGHTPLPSPHKVEAVPQMCWAQLLEESWGTQLKELEDSGDYKGQRPWDPGRGRAHTMLSQSWGMAEVCP